MANTIKITLVLMLLALNACGGGGTINLGNRGGEGGNDFDGVGGDLGSIAANNMPGTAVIQTGSNSYDVVIGLGAGVAITDSHSDSGDYQLRNSLLFDN